MKKKLVLFSVTVLCVLLLTTAGSAQDFLKRFSLKLSSGYGSTAGGDMDAVMNGFNSEIMDLASLWGFSNYGTLEDVNWGLDFEGELVFSITKNFAVGLGVGYMQRKNDSFVVLRFDPLTRSSISWVPEYSAIPVNISGYYYYQIAPKIKAFLKAGFGYYAAKINYIIREEYETIIDDGWSQDKGVAKDNRTGFHGGLGFEYNLTGNISLYAEGMGRYINFDTWKVDNTYTNSLGVTVTESGRFWYLEEYNDITGKYYASIMLTDQITADPSLRNVRKIRIGLSGFSFRVGVKIGFGK